ncbi:hypothetical protein KSF78_0008533, partial [Schistosoma japonicum]
PFEDGGILNYLFEPIIVNTSLVNNSSINIITTTTTSTTTSTTTINDTTDRNNSVILLKLTEINDSYAFFNQILHHMLFDVIACSFARQNRIIQTDMNCFNNNDNDAVVSCRSNQCNQIQPVASLHSIEWIMKNDANHSTNSSNISINNSLYNHQLSNQSLTKSITLSSSSSPPPPPPPPTTTTNHHNIQQSIDNQFTSFMMITSSQLNSQRKIYLIFQFIIYCLLCINISLCIVCFYAMEVNYQQFNVMNTTQTTFHYVLMNEVVSKLTDYLQEIINQGEFYTKQTFVTIEKSINKQLSITADRIIESLLEFYKLSSVIQTAESITQSINDTIIVSQIINSQQNVLQQDVNNYIGELYGYANLLNSTLNSICKSSSVLVFLIRDLNIDLSLITNQFNVVQNESFKSFTLKIHGKYKKNAFQLQLHRLFYLPHVINKLHLKCLTTICLATNSFLCLLLCCLFILFTLLLLIDTELCRYVNTEHGSELLDSIIDLYLKYAWRQIFTENVTILGNQINFPIPKKIYSTLRNQCQRHSTTELTDNTTNENYSFLRLLNYTKFINFNEILYSSSVQKKIDDAKSSLTTFPRKLSVYLDGKDYRVTSDVKNLQEPITVIINASIQSLLNEMTMILNTEFDYLFSHLLPCDKFNKVLMALLNVFCDRTQSIVLSLSSYIIIICITLLLIIITLFLFILYSRKYIELCMYTKWENIPLYASLLIIKFYNRQLLHDKLAINVTSDVKNLQEPITAIINASIQSLLNEMTMILNTEFDYLFSHLLPCDKFNKVLMTLLNVFCDRTQSIVLSLSSYIIIICITLLLIIITLFLFILYSRKYIELCMYTKWENIPLYASVKLCHQLLKYD